MMKQEVTISGMTCAGCANSVKTKFESIQGIHSVEMDLENQKAVLDVEFEIPKSSLQTVLIDTNYKVEESIADVPNPEVPH